MNFTVIFKGYCKLSLKPYKGGKIPKLRIYVTKLPGSWGIHSALTKGASVASQTRKFFKDH